MISGATSWPRARGTSLPASWPSVTSAIVKSGESRYLVEPDVKDGKGGLRDLHTLFWIAKFLYATNSTDELAEKGAFTREELAIFKKCERLPLGGPLPPAFPVGARR